MSYEFSPKNKEYYDNLAQKLEEFLLKDKSLPRFISTIVGLLRKGDIKSAIATFKWEEDKLSNKEVKDLLNKSL